MTAIPALRGRIPPAFVPESGDVVTLGPRHILIVEVGRLEHSGGYGPVEMRGVDLFDHPFAPGTMVKSPWGDLEIVAVDDGRYVGPVARARLTRTFRTAEAVRPADDEDLDDEGLGGEESA